MLKNFKPISLILLAGTFCFPKSIYANPVPAKQSMNISQQKGNVTGTVEDDFGPVAGASVVVKGTTNGNITDMDGNFTLTGVKNGDVILISFIGYITQEIKYTGQPTIKVKFMEDTQKLDEVVVTALGMRRSEKALGYAVTELKGDDLKTNAINPVASLQGKVAGVEISGSDGGLFGSTKIQIRGASTLKGNNQPIYVVDGVILDNGMADVKNANFEGDANDYGNELKNLNPDDFATVSVLKGAAATALYGSRGLNGAVVITTKSGEGTKGYGVSFNQTFGIDHVFSAPDLQNEYGIGNYSGNVKYGATAAAGNYNIWDNAGQFYLNAAGNPTLIGSNSARHWGPRYDGRDIELYDGSIGRYSPSENNMTDVYQLGFNSNTNVAVRGGNDKTTFYTSASYKYASGTQPNNTFNRLSLLFKGSHKISERVDLAAAVSVTNSTPKNAPRSIGQMFIDGGLTRMYDAKYYRNKYLGDHGGVASNGYGDKYGDVPGKSLWFGIDNNETIHKENVVRPQLTLNIKLTDWAKLSLDGNMNFYNRRTETKQLGEGYANEGGYYGLSSYSKDQQTYSATFTFNKAVSDFSFGGFLRGEYWTTGEQSNSTNTNGGLVVPGQYFVGNSKNTVSTTAELKGRKDMMSAIFSATASYKNQYFLEITGRNDWSSALVYTNATGNYSYFYPSVSGSWLLNETFELPDWVSLGKIRASWAQVGNDTNAYYINQGYSLGYILQSSGANIFTNGVPKLLYDPSLKPERKNAWEFGVDFRFLESRINLDATYYKENTHDQIIEVSAPGVSGISGQLVNAGNIQNSGVEIALNTVPFRNKDWEWTLDLTYTKNTNKIISLHEDVGDFIELGGEWEYNYRVKSVAYVGGDYGVLMSKYTPKRDENGQILLEWSDDFRAAYPSFDNTKAEVIGSMNPDFLGSIATGLKYKNFNLRVAMDMRFGGMIASYSNRYGLAYGSTESSLKYRDTEHGGLTWTSQFGDSKGQTFHDGVIPEGVFPAGQKVLAPSGKYVEVGGMSFAEAYKAGYVEPVHASTYHYWNNAWTSGTINDQWFSELNYIALREVTLGYKVPTAFANKLGAKNLNLSFSARNLGYLYNSLPNDLNPESIRGTDGRNSFMERSFSPYTANYMFTLNMEF